MWIVSLILLTTRLPDYRVVVDVSNCVHTAVAILHVNSKTYVIPPTTLVNMH